MIEAVRKKEDEKYGESADAGGRVRFILSELPCLSPRLVPSDGD